jgi:hypothetical protein
MALVAVTLCATCTWMHAIVFDSTNAMSFDLPLSAPNTTFGACFTVANATGIGRVVFPISADVALDVVQIRASLYALEGQAHPRIINSSTHHTRWLPIAFSSPNYRFLYVDLGLGVGVHPTGSDLLGICLKIEMLNAFDVSQPFSVAELNASEPVQTAFGWELIASGPWDAFAVQRVPDNGITAIQSQSGDTNKLAMRVHGRVPITGSPAPTPSCTHSSVPTVSVSASSSITPTSTGSPSVSATATATKTPTASPSWTPSETAAAAGTPTASPSGSPSASPSLSPSPSKPAATFAAVVTGDTDIGTHSVLRTIAAVGGDVYVGNAANPICNTEFKAKGIARYNTAAKTWNKLPCGSDNGVNGAVNTILADGTSIIIGGSFTSLSNGTGLSGIVRYEEPGIWTNLTSSNGNTGVNSDVNVLIMYASKVYACGAFTTLSNGSTANRVASFDPATSTWSALIGESINGLGGPCYALVTGGNDLYIGGSFSKLGDQSTVVNFVAKWNGTTWSQLNGYLNGVQSTVNALAYISPYLYIGTGTSSFAVSGTYNYLARWNGTTFSAVPCPDTGNGVSTTVRALGVLGTDLIIQGSFYYYGRAANSANQTSHGIVRYTPSTGVYSRMGSGFDPAGSGIYAMSIINSTIWTTTGVYNVNGDLLNYMGVYNGSEWNGVTATQASVGVTEDVNAMHMANGTTLMYIGGTFIYLRGGMRCNYIATFDTVTKAWGQLSVNGAAGVNSEVYAIAAISATEVYIGGKFTATKSGLSVGGVVMWNGTAWTALQGGNNNGITVSGSAYVMAIAKVDNYVFIGGSFTSLSNGTTASYVARWDGTSWSTVRGGTKQGLSNTVQCLLAVGSTLYIGGTFTTATDTTIQANRFAQWNVTGGIQRASLSNKGANSGVSALAYDGRYIYMGGLLYATVVGTSAALTNVNYIVRFDPVLDQWSKLSVGGSAGVSTAVNALCATATVAYLGGGFLSSSSGTTLNKVGGWRNATTSWLQLGNPNLPGLETGATVVYALYCTSDTLYIGGNFITTREDQVVRGFTYVSL